MIDKASSYQQGIFDFKIKNNFDVDNFILGTSNRLAFEYINSWPNWHTNCCVLVGEPGSGKSHLCSIWRLRSGADEILLDEIKDKSQLDFSFSSRNLVLENIDSSSCAEIIFHIINKVKQSGSSLLLTSRDTNIINSYSLADLTSRLREAFLLRLGNGDEVLLSNIFCKLLSDLQVEIDIQCAFYVLKNIDRSYQSVIKAVACLNKLSLESGRPITTRFISEQISNLRSL